MKIHLEDLYVVYIVEINGNQCVQPIHRFAFANDLCNTQSINYVSCGLFCIA